jgi:hypothetical protein
MANTSFLSFPFYFLNPKRYGVPYNKNKMKTNKFFSALAIIIALFSTSAIVKAQTAPAPYGIVSFIKTLPNMNESFLIDMKTSKKLANGRVANKNILSWQLYRTAMPTGSIMDYNYFTLAVYPSGKEMKAEGANDAVIKGMSAKEIADFYTSLGNTRTSVANDLVTYKMGVGAKMLPGEYVQINSVNVKTGSGAAYLKLVESYKPVIEECIKAGKLKGFNVWGRTYATNVNGEIDYFVIYSFATLDQALSWASGKTGATDEYKKIYPKDDLANFTIKVNELRDVVSQGLFELVDITD